MALLYSQLYLSLLTACSRGRNTVRETSTFLFCTAANDEAHDAECSSLETCEAQSEKRRKEKCAKQKVTKTKGARRKRCCVLAGTQREGAEADEMQRCTRTGATGGGHTWLLK